MGLPGKLIESAMAEAAGTLVGEHDFSAFRGAGCQSRIPVRRLERLAVARSGAYVHIEACANGFLYHMVRNIVGALVRVGSGEAGRSWMAELLASRDRRLGAPTAPPEGLYLAGVRYPADLALPGARPEAVWHDH